MPMSGCPVALPNLRARKKTRDGRADAPGEKGVGRALCTWAAWRSRAVLDLGSGYLHYEYNRLTVMRTKLALSSRVAIVIVHVRTHIETETKMGARAYPGGTGGPLTMRVSRHRLARGQHLQRRPDCCFTQAKPGITVAPTSAPVSRTTERKVHSSASTAATRRRAHSYTMKTSNSRLYHDCQVRILRFLGRTTIVIVRWLGPVCVSRPAYSAEEPE